MSLDVTLNKLVQKAMKKVESLGEKVTYTSVVTGAYNPATDSHTTNTIILTNVTAIFEKLLQNEIDSEIRNLVDIKILIAALDIPGIVPVVEDSITSGAKTFKVKKVDSVPGNSLWILYARRG